jgi:hypothetical protein
MYVMRLQIARALGGAHEWTKMRIYTCNETVPYIKQGRRAVVSRFIRTACQKTTQINCAGGKKPLPTSNKKKDPFHN